MSRKTASGDVKEDRDTAARFGARSPNECDAFFQPLIRGGEVIDAEG
jgi:hypothetical protein